MHEKKITEVVFFILLLASLIACVYLVLHSNIQKSTIIENLALSKKPSIGVVEVFGQVYSPHEENSIVSSSNFQEILNTIKSFREEEKVKAVIIRINSPGGTVGAVQEICQEIRRLKESGKPVVASILDIAASGGYYIASECNEIVSNRGSMIGSIGVIFMTSDFSELLEKIGVNIETVKSGPYKDVGSFHRPLSHKEKKFLKELIDDAYDQFVEVVAKGRKMPLEKVRKFAQGQLYTGRKAKKLALVDTLGDINVAKSRAEKLAGIKDSVLVKEPRVRWKKILNILSKGVSFRNILEQNNLKGLAYIYRQ